MARKSGNGYANIGRSNSERSADIADANAERFLDVVHKLLTVGDGLFLSRTRDGSAIRVQIFSGDDKQSWYVPNADEFDALMGEISSYLDKTAL